MWNKDFLTYAFFTSSIFKGPFVDRPSIVLSEAEPTAYDSSLDSISLGLCHFLFLLLVQFESSLHSNPFVEFLKKDSSHDLNYQVYHLFPNVAWKVVPECSSKSSEKLSRLNLPEWLKKKQTSIWKYTGKKSQDLLKNWEDPKLLSLILIFHFP